MLEQLLSLNAFALLLVFARVGTALGLLPGLSAAYVSIRIRLLLALALSMLLTPVLANRLPDLPATPLGLAMLVIGEVIIGAFLGTLTRILVAALQAAGTFASYFASMANAMVQDPIAEAQSSTVAGFFMSLGVLLIFVTDLHHVMLEAILGTYDLFPPGGALPVGDFAEMLARQTAASIALGLQMAAPFLLVGFVYYLGLGILGRLMPQLPVFFFGLPLQISLQLWVMMLTLSAIMLLFLGAFAEGIGGFAGL